MRIHIVFLFFLLSLLTGCGSQSDDFVVTSGGSEDFSPPTTVVGHVFLGANVEGATLRIETLGGQVLASGTTIGGGLVHFEELSVPKDFRAVATLQGSDIEFSSQFRNFDPTNRQVHVSVLSTLASEVIKTRPGLTLAEAEALVKTALELPQGLQLGVSLGEPNPVFSSIAFFREAGLNGGWNAYKNSILSLSETAGQNNLQPRRFLFSLDQLSRPINGLEPGLSEVVEKVRNDVADRLGFTPAPRLDTNATLAPPLTLLASPTSSGGQFLFDVAKDLTGNVLSSATDGLLGWAANQLGLNYGDSEQLQEINVELKAIENTLIQLTSEITDSIVQSEINDLITEFNPIIHVPQNGGNPTGAHVTLSSNINTALTGINNGSRPPLNEPSQTNINDLVAALNAPDYATILRDADTSLTGTGGIILGVQDIIVNQETGLDRPGRFLFFPWRHNRVIDKVLPVYQKFANLQGVALNIYSESAHNYLIYENPVDGINAITPDVKANIASQKAQRQLLPFRNSLEGITPDLENGVMWYDYFWANTTYNGAKSTADTLTEQVILPDGSVHVYDDWHLPTFGEFRSLQDRGAYVPNAHKDTSVPHNSFGDYPDIGSATTGLPQLGFYNVAHALTQSPKDNGANGDLWMSYYEVVGQASQPNGVVIRESSDYEFRLNHEDRNKSSSGDRNAYCVARTMGPTVIVTPFAQVDAPYPEGLAPAAISGTNFVAGEYAQYGLPTAIEIKDPTAAQPVVYPKAGGSNSTFTAPEGSVQFDADITYEIQVGGNFSVGYGSTQPRNNPSKSYTQKVSTNTVGSTTNAYNALRELINWTVANSDGTAIERMNLLNVPFASGIGIPLNSGEVTVTATLLGAGANPITGTLNYNVQPAEKTLVGLQISPRNQLYGADVSRPVSGPNANYSYYCTGFYSDGTVQSLGGVVDWEVTPTPNDANAQITISGGTATLKLNQPAVANPEDYQLTITATYEGLSDSTLIEISPPVAQP